MNLFSKNHNKRTRFTRMCIGEAVFALMDKKEYEKIKVSDIVKSKGMMPMTPDEARAMLKIPPLRR